MALPFQRICDCGTKLLPFTVSKTGSTIKTTVFGDSDTIWGAGGRPKQLWKPMIAVQVQPDNAKIKTAMKPIWAHGEGLSEWISRERTPPPLAGVCSCNVNVLRIQRNWQKGQTKLSPQKSA